MLDVLLAVCVLVVGVEYLYVRHRTAQIHRVPLASAPSGSSAARLTPLVDPPPGGPFNVLLVGSDSRSFVGTASDKRSFGSGGDVGGERSDTIMVVRLDPRRRTVQLLSIHRDLWVEIDGTGRSEKINAALDGGPGRLLRTLNDQLGLEISHYIKVDFDGFRRVVDSLGPVPFYFPTPVRDAYTGLNIGAAGCARLDAGSALALVRSRHLEYQTNGRWASDLTDDRGRILRQQQFLKRVLELAVAHGFDSPRTAEKVIGDIAPNLTIDSGWATVDLVRLVRRFRGVAVGEIKFGALPTLDDNINGLDVEAVDEPSADAALSPFGGRSHVLPIHGRPAVSTGSTLPTTAPLVTDPVTTTTVQAHGLDDNMPCS